MNPSYRYRAFLSYSHADEKWAKWLHRSLETYRVPKHLIGRETEFGPVPGRIAPVFRDRDELATATNLGATLTRALEQSAAQVVICSRKAARSRWVNEEILTFKRFGRSHRIFALVVDGEPGASSNPEIADQECFPNALIYRIGADGQLTEQRDEPIAADVRPGKDSKLDVKLKLVAGMLGVGLDELKLPQPRIAPTPHASRPACRDIAMPGRPFPRQPRIRCRYTSIVPSRWSACGAAPLSSSTARGWGTGRICSSTTSWSRAPSLWATFLRRLRDRQVLVAAG